MIGGTLETHTAEEGDKAKRGTAVDGLEIWLYLYIFTLLNIFIFIYVMIYDILLSFYISLSVSFCDFGNVDNFRGTVAVIRERFTHTASHWKWQEQIFVTQESLTNIVTTLILSVLLHLSSQFRETSNFTTKTKTVYRRPPFKNKNICFIPIGSIFGGYFCYDSVEYLPVLPPTHRACQISRKSWGESLS